MTICGIAEHSSWILIAKFSPKKVSPLEITLASLKKSKNCPEIIAVKLFKNSPKKIELINLANDPKHKMALSRHRDILSDWIKLTGDKGQVVESDIGLLATMKRWGNLCVNPEYDRVRDKYKEWKASQQSPSKAKKKVSSR